VVLENKLLVTVAEIQRDQVKLRVECPEEYSIQVEEGREPVRRGGDSPIVMVARRKFESFAINRNITITIVEIIEDKVRLGIVAPKDCSVHRKEVFDAIHGTP
jgi:carbon storage regulator